MRSLLVVPLLLVACFALPTVVASPCQAGVSTPYYAHLHFGSPYWFAILQESNGVPGLQTEPCEDADGRTIPSDAYVYRSMDHYPDCPDNVCPF